MHPSGWISLVQTIPPQFHDGLTMLLANGSEFNIQAIVRMEEQFMVVRGRTMGSTDAGLVFFVPYEQITTLGYSKTLKEEVVQAWFQDGPAYAVSGAPALPRAPRPELAPAGMSEEEAEPGLEEAEEAAPAAAGPTPARPSAPGVPRPAPAAPRPLPAGPTPSALPLSGMPLPAKAAMIERLRKKAAAPGAPKPPEQK
jgi:hypothetical protein